MARSAIIALILALWAALAPPMAAAQENAPSPPEDARPDPQTDPQTDPWAEAVDIPPDAWRALTQGRTVWYRIGPDLWGRERYWPGSNRVTFQFADGLCLEAVWTYAAPWYCFAFETLGEAPHCFRHLRLGDALFALSLDGEVQAIDRIDASPLGCGGDQVS